MKTTTRTRTIEAKMGRKKLELKRLETLKDRSSKYSKRKKGILKKAEEMAILCDVDIALLLFSPTSKPCLFTRPRSLSRILERLHNVPFRDRQERKAYTIKMLKKMYGKKEEASSDNDDHPSSERDEMVVEENANVAKLRETKNLLDKRTSLLRDWYNPNKVDDMNRLNIMEGHLVTALNQIENMKN